MGVRLTPEERQSRADAERRRRLCRRLSAAERRIVRQGDPNHFAKWHSAGQQPRFPTADEQAGCVDAWEDSDA